ncbi:MAG TPA: glycoside hydrolase family 2 TIM barrel-domain containing protein [Conexibacter sp.]|jgi:beta-glucuronidase|nr:glycoside hydrolase family 2 TIM barrel-domain containing protein [Conexibacter sp.]
MRRRSPFLPLLALVLAAPAPALAATPAPGGTAPPYRVDTPRVRPHAIEGQDSRYLLDGAWLLRLDPTDTGLGQRLYAQTTTDGWTTTTVPRAWNAGDDSAASFLGSVAWYRKDFRLPSRDRALAWIARFESANYRATVWLNGRKLGEHVSGYVPFELDLPNASPRGVNRLVVRVDNRRPATDPIGARGEIPEPPGGWWNYGGLLREVSLRAVDRVDIENVQVQPALKCPRCAATITASASVRNLSHATQTVRLTGRFGSAPIDFGTQAIPARASTVFTRQLVVRRPKLWSPADPNLYGVRLAASAAQGRGGATAAAGYTLRTGIRTVAVSSSGRLVLNGNTIVHFRGVALHEDTLANGPVMSHADRQHVIALMKASGSTLLRAHYPLDPDFQDLADQSGILLWSEIPAPYQLPEADLGRALFRDVALGQLRANILANRNHPSVAAWSIGNEMASAAGPNQAAYISAAAALARQLDPTRPVALAFAGHPETPCQAAYAPIDLLGMNDYFGWYTGFGGNIADRDQLPSFLDDLRRCYPRKAIAVTEYGAEANRDGPAEEKGTYQFQRDFIRFHLGVFATKSWLTGSVYWALQEFRVRPGWGGGNPWGAPPLHEKGLVRLDWTKKPGFTALADGQRTVRQYVPLHGGR